MKKQLSIIIIMFVLLFAGCGRNTENNNKGGVNDSAIENIDEVSDNFDLDSKNANVFNYGGSFIGVDDLVYFVALDEGGFERSSLAGNYRKNLIPGKTYSLMCYNTTTKECIKICDTNIIDKLSYYDGHLYGTGYDEESNSFVYDTDIKTGEVTKLVEGSIACVDKNSGDFVVNNISTELSVYKKGELVTSVTTKNEQDSFWDVYIIDDNLFYLETIPDETEGYMKPNNTFFHQYNISEKRDYNLGNVCEELDDFYDYFSLDQVALKGEDIYYSIGFYAGTGHFLNEAFVVKAKLNSENSTSLFEKNNLSEVYSDIFLESALPEIKYINNQPGSCNLNYDSQTIEYYFEDSGDVKAEELYKTDNIKINKDTDSLVELSEYFDGAGYFVINEAIYSPENSIGWRDAYTVYNTIYVRAVPGEEPEQILSVHYSEIKNTKFTVVNPCDGYYISVDNPRDIISENLYKPYKKTYEEPNEIIDNDKFYNDYNLDPSILYDTGECEINVINEYDYSTKEEYWLSLTDKSTGANVCKLEVSEFYDPSNVASYAVNGINEGWYNDFRYGYVKDNILYASFGHRTYAETMPASSFIVAIDLSDGSVIWKTANQICNSNNFIVKDNIIICGYGFTDEPDYIYFISRFSGEKVDEIKTKTSPDEFFDNDNKLFVRCYDTNYIFEVQK